MIQTLTSILQSLSFSGNLYSIAHHTYTLLARLGILQQENDHKKAPRSAQSRRLRSGEKQLKTMRCCNDMSFVLIGAYSAYLNSTSDEFFPINAVATGLAIYDMYELVKKNQISSSFQDKNHHSLPKKISALN